MKTSESKITFRLDKELENKFQEHCKKHGYSISKRIRILIEQDISK